MSTKGHSLAINLATCPCGGGTLDKLIQPAILIVLLEGPLHGYRLAERIGDMAMFGGEKPDPSGVYRTLKAMETKGLVVSSWDTSERGPAKKAYRITSSGEGCLRHWIKTLEKYREGIAALLKLAKNATAH
jgi:poly-beta-hydroxybutyrate-responsive repressor